jgi:triphosphoribosyl-dephospho-CoA synthetase
MSIPEYLSGLADTHKDRMTQEEYLILKSPEGRRVLQEASELKRKYKAQGLWGLSLRHAVRNEMSAKYRDNEKILKIILIIFQILFLFL